METECRRYLHTQEHARSPMWSPSLNIDKQVIGSIQTEGMTGGALTASSMCVCGRFVNAADCLSVCLSPNERRLWTVSMFQRMNCSVGLTRGGCVSVRVCAGGPKKKKRKRIENESRRKRENEWWWKLLYQQNIRLKREMKRGENCSSSLLMCRMTRRIERNSEMVGGTRREVWRQKFNDACLRIESRMDLIVITPC
jgi:hypothetical protein